MTFSDKVKWTRELLGLTQQELADLVGVTKRAVAGWETEGALPRPATLRKLADTLQVSIEYLRIDSIENPLYGIEKKNYVDEARDRYGEVAAKEMEFLLERQRVFFAGGEISQDAKDAFFEAVMKAYLACKEEAKRKAGL